MEKNGNDDHAESNGEETENDMETGIMQGLYRFQTLTRVSLKTACVRAS